MELERRYFDAEPIPSKDFNDEGLPFFGHTVYPEVRKGKASGQYTLDNEILWRRNTPLVIMTPQKEHLIRPTDEELRYKRGRIV